MVTLFLTVRACAVGHPGSFVVVPSHLMRLGVDTGLRIASEYITLIELPFCHRLRRAPECISPNILPHGPAFCAWGINLPGSVGCIRATRILCVPRGLGEMGDSLLSRDHSWKW